MTNPRNLQHPRRDSLLIAIAGPISNLLQVPVWLLLVFLVGVVDAKMGTSPALGANAVSAFGLLAQVMFLGVTVNIGLAAFNMIPIPPLDGHWVLQSIGGRPIEELFDMIRPYSFIVLIAIINFTPLLSLTLGPVRQWAAEMAYQVSDAGHALGMR